MTECACVKLNRDGSLVRAAAPERAGIRSETVLKMLEYLEEKDFQYHSFMIVRHGMVAAECYRHPFQKDIPHTMYSVSKTITATAVGLAIAEGFLQLDTRLIDVFPAYRKKNEKNDYIEKLTVHHLLSMQSGKLPSPLLNKTDDDWLKHLLDAKWGFAPGTQFAYVNENMYALCAILNRVTGMSVVDFLMPRLFAPLGIERPVWETDGHGVEAGGWGIFLKTEDLAKIMLCYCNGGKWGTRQLLPADWVWAATRNQHGQTPPVREDGYGYGIWTKNENEYEAGGMFTQIARVFEKEDCIALVTACSPTEAPFCDALQMLRDEGFTDVDDAAQPDAGFIKSLAAREVDVIPKSRLHSALESRLQGKTIHFRKTLLLNVIGFPVSVLHLAAVYMSNYRAGNIDAVHFDFEKGTLYFSWQEGEEHNRVRCPMDGTYATTPVTLAHLPFTAAATAFWGNERTLHVWIRPLESLCCRKLRFTFADNGTVRMQPSSSPSVGEIVASIEGEIHAMLPPQKYGVLADKVVGGIKKTVEPLHRGRLLK